MSTLHHYVLVHAFKIFTTHLPFIPRLFSMLMYNDGFDSHHISLYRSFWTSSANNPSKKGEKNIPNESFLAGVPHISSVEHKLNTQLGLCLYFGMKCMDACWCFPSPQKFDSFKSLRQLWELTFEWWNISQTQKKCKTWNSAQTFFTISPLASRTRDSSTAAAFIIFSAGYSCWVSPGCDIHTCGGFNEACRCVKGCLYSAAVSGSEGAPTGLSPLRLTELGLISLRGYWCGCCVHRGPSHRLCTHACTYVFVFMAASFIFTFFYFAFI